MGNWREGDTAFIPLSELQERSTRTWLNRQMARVTALDTYPRALTISTGSQVSGAIGGCVFRPDRAFTATKVSVISGTTAATSMTVIRLGVARINNYGAHTEDLFSGLLAVNVTPLVETANLAGSILTGANIAYPNNAFSAARGLAASIAFDPNLEYIFYYIGVSTGTNCSVRGAGPGVTGMQLSMPLFCLQLGGQADIPITAFNLTAAGGQAPWGRFHA